MVLIFKAPALFYLSLDYMINKKSLLYYLNTIALKKQHDNAVMLFLVRNLHK